MKWVRLKKYCELSGDTANAVRMRRKRGVWLDGLQTRLAPDKRLWVNLDEVDRWVEKNMNEVIYKNDALKFQQNDISNMT